VLIEKKLGEIGARLEHTPLKSLSRLSQETGISKSSAAKSIKLLKIRPCKLIVIHALKPRDPASRIDFCNWFLKSVHDGEVGPHFTYFCDEAWFHLHGRVSSQNHLYWSPVNPHLIHELPLHHANVGVWCEMNTKRIIGPIFYTETI
jgi:hypothetical protein